MTKAIRPLLVFLFIAFGAQRVAAFSLLGPFAPWMDDVKSYHEPYGGGGDIGGPMNLGEGYRWNVPVLTYAFDQAFLNYFGSNGVTAVEQAVAILNDLPPASLINLSDYDTHGGLVNSWANNAYVFDLRSAALSLLLEQMGLADSQRFVFCVRDVHQQELEIPPYIFTNYWIIQRNFDPGSLSPSRSVNEVSYTYDIWDWGIPRRVDAVEKRISASEDDDGTPATSFRFSGLYLTHLTRDDAGGLVYLLSGYNVAVESLPPGVHASQGDPTNFVNTALRPGVEKVSFVRINYDPVFGPSRPFTNQFVDTFFSNGVPVQQMLKRIVTQPDILFSAGDTGSIPGRAGGYPKAVDRTDTSHWVNNGALNGIPDASGPGVIQPPVRITFNNVGPFYFNAENALDEFSGYPGFIWGSFSDTTNFPVLYPSVSRALTNTLCRFQMENQGEFLRFNLGLVGPALCQFNIQTATNLTDWHVLMTVTNSGGVLVCDPGAMPEAKTRFFRARRGSY